MSRVYGIHHVNIEISDRERTQEWYEKVLGLEFIDRGPVANARLLELYMGTGEIHFIETPNPTYLKTNHFAVEVTSWDGMMAHLAELGIPIEGAFNPQGEGGQKTRDHDGSSYAYIRDPDDNLIELVHHPRGLRWVRSAS